MPPLRFWRLDAVLPEQRHRLRAARAHLAVHDDLRARGRQLTETRADLAERNQRRAGNAAIWYSCGSRTSRM